MTKREEAAYRAAPDGVGFIRLAGEHPMLRASGSSRWGGAVGDAVAGDSYGV